MESMTTIQPKDTAVPALVAPPGLLWPKDVSIITYMTLVEADYDTGYAGTWACGECGIIGSGTTGREILHGRWTDKRATIKWPNIPRSGDIDYTHVTCDACLALRTTMLTDALNHTILGDLLRMASSIVSATNNNKPMRTDVHLLAPVVYAMLAVHENLIDTPRVPVAFGRLSIFSHTANGYTPTTTLKQNAEVADAYATSRGWWRMEKWQKTPNGIQFPLAINRWCELTGTPVLCHTAG